MNFVIKIGAEKAFHYLRRHPSIILGFIIVILVIVIISLALTCRESFTIPIRTSSSYRIPTTADGGTADSGGTYNALYTSPDLSEFGSYLYTQPMGDPDAQRTAGSGQGTSGEFLPLQGIGAGVYMKNSSKNNKAVPSPNPGLIGGQPNYTTQRFSSRWNGFNDFGAPFDDQRGPDIHNDNYTNSYLISGANERVTNSGQKSDSTNCQEWYPTLRKDAAGFCTQDSDAMVNCTDPNKNVLTCQGEGAKRFLNSKMKARWESV